MSLKFWNNTNLNLWVAIAHEEQVCTGNKWRKEGWWKLPPGQTAMVWTGATRNKNFLFYAHDESYNYEWEGDYYTDLPDHIFSRCWDEPGGNTRWMKVFTATSDDYTINLVLEDNYQPKGFTAGCNAESFCISNTKSPPQGDPNLPIQCPLITWQEICKYKGLWTFFWSKFKDQNGNDVDDNSWCLVEGVQYDPRIQDFVLIGCIEVNKVRKRVVVPLFRIYCYLYTT